MRRAIVAGAGVSGLAAALLLRRRGWEVEVREAADGPGGLVRPVPFRGLPCDLGSHRLHTEALGDPLLGEMKDAIGLAHRRRCGRIVLQGRQVPYPLTLPGFLRGIGPTTAAAFCAGYLTRRIPFQRWEHDRARAPEPEDDEGFERFVVRRVGRAAYEAFYRPYAEKVWGVSPGELSRSVAKRRVASSRPEAHLMRALTPSRHGQPTFLYPQGGMGAVVDWLERACRREGVGVHYGAPLGGPSGPTDVDADAIVMSGHPRHLIDDPGLRHRGLYLLFLAVDAPDLGPVDTWYVPEDRYWFGRVSQARNFSEAFDRPDETVICAEIPEGAWGPGHDFTRAVPELTEQLRNAGILPPGCRVLEAQQRWRPDVYPLYTRGWYARWREVMAAIARDDRVVPIGRQGLYLQCNIDHCLRIARDAATHLDGGGDASGWASVASGYLGLRVRD